MKRPSFQFYPADWLGNSNLRRCTHADKGRWIDVMCLMHDSNEYGVLRWPLAEIAAAIGCRTTDLTSIVAKGVFKGSDSGLTEPFIYTPRSGRKDGEPVVLIAQQSGPIWFSTRMVKDEYIRTIRGEAVGTTESPKPTPHPTSKATPKGGFGEANGVAFGPRDAGTRAAPSSSSSPSGEEPPKPPKGGKRRGAPVGLKSGLKTWIQNELAAGRKPIPDEDPVLAYATSIGLPHEFLRLAWTVFKDRYDQPGATEYIDWRQVFRNAVERDWLKLWWRDDGAGHFVLTTAGKQARLAHEREAA